MMWLGDNMYLRTPDFLSNTQAYVIVTATREVYQSCNHFWEAFIITLFGMTMTMVQTMLIGRLSISNLPKARLTITGEIPIPMSLAKVELRDSLCGKTWPFSCLTTAIIGHPINQSLRVRIFLDVIKSIG